MTNEEYCMTCQHPKSEAASCTHPNCEVVNDIIKAVAHIGIDFGYGKYELEQKHIDAARRIYDNAQPSDEERT